MELHTIRSCRALAVAACVAFIGCGCTINLPGSAGHGAGTAAPPAQELSKQRPAATSVEDVQPKTLAAATAAAQEKNDRHASGDFAGEWYLFTNQLREGITQNDFVEFSKVCAKIGPPIKAIGVRMEGTDTAIVRLEIFGIMQTRTMVYEENQWRMVPSDLLSANLGKTVQQLIATEKASGGCNS